MCYRNQDAYKKTVSFVRNFLLLLLTGTLALHIHAQTASPLQLVKTIPLPGVTGKFDHFAIDISANRLFVAATGNHSVEAIDLKTDKVVQSITGLGKPHGLAWVAGTGSLYVADGTLAELRVYKGSPLALAGTIKLSDDADDMVYNAAAQRLYIGHGGSDAANPARIAVVDTAKFALVANLPVATHPEALDLDEQGQRIFANIADSNEVAVVDGAANSITAHWKLTKAADNVPLAYDSEHKVLFVACRKPGTLIAIDAASGNELASAPADGGADDLFYDAALHRVYLISGAGAVDVYEIDSQRQIHPLDVLHTVNGAKTALFVPSRNALYVGIPGVAGKPAEIRVYATPSTRGNQ